MSRSAPGSTTTRGPGRPRPRACAALGAAAGVALAAAIAPVAHADTPANASGRGGAVASVDRDATQAGVRTLRAGGNAVDAAVATAAALGVTEPYSAGIGGGGYMVIHRPGKAPVAIDGRETAPGSLGVRGFLDADGKPRDFDDVVTSGLSVGVPGTPATWESATRRYRKRSFGANLAPAVSLARNGFEVDATFRGQTVQNKGRFGRFPATRRIYLPGGNAPKVGTTSRNPDLARTYETLGRSGTGPLYRGSIGRDLVRAVRRPASDRGKQPFRSGMTTRDLATYDAIVRPALQTRFRGLDVVGMPPSSGGGIGVAQILGLVEARGAASPSPTVRTHRFLDASRLAFADRNRWVGDPRYERIPAAQLTDPAYLRGRACELSDTKALTEDATAGDPYAPGCGSAAARQGTPSHEGPSTTHLVAADRSGTVVSYTLTIEQTGGSGMVVPGRGFLLNNELTDFDFEPPEPGAAIANLPAPGKRPRSSMSPTIVLDDGEPLLAVGSPGGATIITTVAQVLLDRLDGGRTLREAIRAPRVSQRNADETEAEPGFLDGPQRRPLEALGHEFTEAPATFDPKPEIGAVAALERTAGGTWRAAAEPVRRGGGSAGAVR